MPFETETTLTLSDSSLTTQASSLLATAGLMFTDTGSMPTGISAINAGLAGVAKLNTDKVALGVLTTNKRVPSAEIRTGLTCAPSKLTYELGAWAARGTAASTARSALNGHACFIFNVNMNPPKTHHYPNTIGFALVRGQRFLCYHSLRGASTIVVLPID